MKYLRGRGINKYEIEKYNLGFCQSGRYENRVIVPSYDINGNLNYFTGRSILNNGNYKYLNPQVEKNHIIVFENMINWGYPVVLVQGMFDAMAVNFNAIPLMGKQMPKYLLEKILFYDAEVIISLDDDAKDDQTQILKTIYNKGVDELSYLRLKGKDPSEMGMVEYWNQMTEGKVKFTVNNALDMLKEKIGGLDRNDNRKKKGKTYISYF